MVKFKDITFKNIIKVLPFKKTPNPLFIQEFKHAVSYHIHLKGLGLSFF